jgi:hypothetical protein
VESFGRSKSTIKAIHLSKSDRAPNAPSTEQPEIAQKQSPARNTFINSAKCWDYPNNYFYNPPEFS